MPSFDWLEYFSVAENLSNSGHVSHSDEAVQRTITSRAYYACHKLATSQIDELYNVLSGTPLPRNAIASFLVPKDGNAHDFVIDYLKNTPSVMQLDISLRRQFKITGEAIKTLKKRRREADYLANISDPNIHGTVSLGIAKKIIDVLQNEFRQCHQMCIQNASSM